jgi:hypothetical protein
MINRGPAGHTADMPKHLLLAPALALITAAAAVGCGDGGDGGERAELVVDDGGGGPASELALGATLVGQRAAATIRVTNAGSSATGPIALAISGAAANDFGLDNERTTCAGIALAAGGSCEVAIVFTPRAVGERRATLAVASEPGGVAQVALVGQALLPSLVLQPASLSLGRVEAGHLAQGTIEIRNAGAIAAPLDSIAVTGAAGFARGISTCGAVLGPGESCDVTIRLVPQALGPLAGSLAVVSGGVGYTAPLAAVGARRVSVAIAGSGAGTVTSAPAGIDCGAATACEALFDTDAITLTAAPGASSVLVGWSVGACGQGATCSVPAQLEPLAITVSFAQGGTAALDLVIAGDASGEVQIEGLFSGVPPVTCFASCTVPLQPGTTYELTAATPSGFGGIAGACTSADGPCTFTAPVGTVAATVTFAKDPKERWTRLPGAAPVRALAYDGSGNLIVAAAGVTKLSPAGGTMWTVPLGGVHHLAAGPGGTIYVVDTVLRKLDASGAEQWARALPPHAEGCGAAAAFERCLAVGADGAVAIHGTTGVARWDAAGALSWALPVPSGLRAVAIDVGRRRAGDARVLHGRVPRDAGDRRRGPPHGDVIGAQRRHARDRGVLARADHLRRGLGPDRHRRGGHRRRPVGLPAGRHGRSGDGVDGAPLHGRGRAAVVARAEQAVGRAAVRPIRRHAGRSGGGPGR